MTSATYELAYHFIERACEERPDIDLNAVLSNLSVVAMRDPVPLEGDEFDEYMHAIVASIPYSCARINSLICDFYHCRDAPLPTVFDVNEQMSSLVARIHLLAPHYDAATVLMWILVADFLICTTPFPHPFLRAMNSHLAERYRQACLVQDSDDDYDSVPESCPPATPDSVPSAASTWEPAVVSLVPPAPAPLDDYFAAAEDQLFLLFLQAAAAEAAPLQWGIAEDVDESSDDESDDYENDPDYDPRA